MRDLSPSRPSANLKFLSAVMWDGRESAAGHAIRDGLVKQALDAVTGHAQGAPPSPAQLEATVDFQLGPSMPGACATPANGLDPLVFTLFRGWTNAGSPARVAIARGRPISMTAPLRRWRM